MEKIKSFLKDHNSLQPGFYFSGVQNGVSTFDLRFKKPNQGDFLSPAAMHSIEHMMATALRNGEHKEDVIYFGPMGCLTGFYLLTTNVDENTARQMTVSALKTVQDFDSVPGALQNECGNYLAHDLDGAKAECAKYLRLLQQR